MRSVFISEVPGNTQLLDGGAMFGNAPRTLWEKWITPDALSRIPLACRAMLVEIDGLRVLCETGIGAFFEPQLAERFGVQTPTEHRLLQSLAQLGLRSDDIDVVILSHLHFDHAGGLLPTHAEIQAGHDGLAFERALILVGEEAFARNLQPHPRDRASFIPDLTAKLERSGRLRIVPAGNPHCTWLPDVFEFLYSEGHTPGQMLTRVRGANTSVIFAGDLIPGTHWIHLPITMGYDRFAECVIDEKAQLYAHAANDTTLFFYTHDVDVAMSRIARDARGRFHATDIVPHPQRYAL